VADISIAEAGAKVQTQPVSRRERLRALPAAYPRAVWMMALCNLILWTGRGIVIPFTVIYFSQIVGIQASIVGAGIAVSGLGGIAFVMVVAGQIDRRGGRPVLLACMSVLALATVGYPWATSIPLFLLVTVVLTFASQLYWPSSDATIASITDPSRVAEAMSILRVANAVGIGMGGFIGGTLAAGGGMSEYRVVFLTSAAMVFSAALLVWRTVPHVVLPSKSETGEHGTWADVLPDRTFVYSLVILFTLVFGFTQITMSVPAFLRAEAGIGEGTIGLLFTMNTIVVVLAQIPITAKVNRRHVSRPLALGALLWAISFGWFLLTPSLGVPAAIAAFLAFTAGELLFMPITAIIPVRLAPMHLRGRYFSLSSVVWGGSYAFASLVGGLALDLPNPAVLWPVMTVLMLAGGIGALRLHRSERLNPVEQTATTPA
jgi:MFS family permease